MKLRPCKPSTCWNRYAARYLHTCDVLKPVCSTLFTRLRHAETNTQHVIYTPATCWNRYAARYLHTCDMLKPIRSTLLTHLRRAETNTQHVIYTPATCWNRYAARYWHTCDVLKPIRSTLFTHLRRAETGTQHIANTAIIRGTRDAFLDRGVRGSGGGFVLHDPRPAVDQVESGVCGEVEHGVSVDIIDWFLRTKSGSGKSGADTSLDEINCSCVSSPLTSRAFDNLPRAYQGLFFPF